MTQKKINFISQLISNIPHLQSRNNQSPQLARMYQACFTTNLYHTNQPELLFGFKVSLILKHEYRKPVS